MMTLSEQLSEQLGIDATDIMVINDGENIYLNGKLWDLKDWKFPLYAIRIVAPKELALAYPEIYVWFQVNDFPIEKREGQVLLYCNEILPQHQPLIDAIESIYVEKRPVG
jgi:hypothetical protein